jgi:hypothetical protein
VAQVKIQRVARLKIIGFGSVGSRSIEKSHEGKRK